ncbi:MAG: zinc-ribbon domain containing protein [Candidatus Gastranaerophilales bacterium]|nr:zinc-ribbon domain containing protein [Candidatus Gastranaerophilales bacterium]
MLEQNFTDRDLRCADCAQTFTFSAEEQEFYAQKGFSEPKRCPECRSARKMNSRSGGGGRGPRPQYDVICSECGCQTTVPFEPKSDRPVYCSDCYKKNNSY